MNATVICVDTAHVMTSTQTLPFASLWISANGKLVMGQEVAEIMLSIAPMARFYLHGGTSTE
jgi:hypothetical protein